MSTQFRKNQLVSLARDPMSLGVILDTMVQKRYHGAIGNTNTFEHYQIYWSAGTHTGIDIEECWHRTEELTQAGAGDVS